MDAIIVALSGFWLMLPAFVPNSAAVLFGGGRPIDFNRSWHGKRILGDGKTWTGLIGGISAGVAVGILQMMIGYFAGDKNGLWGFGSLPSAFGIIIAFAVGSLLGDLCGAFIKRRLGLQRGAKAPVLDQYNFIAGALIAIILFFPAWFMSSFVDGASILALLTILIVTPILHRAVNIYGHRLGLKKEPW
jgi:CDP-2,3-bis-(O-geranylgeranyl)-sn-glycerol synthase